MVVESLKVLSLYRHIIRSAKCFPSKNRLKIVDGIRKDFRINASLVDRKAINEAINLAVKGLDQLDAYSKLPKSRGDWQVQLDSNPMPKNEEK